jgi:RNA polymerase sigma-70 factor (ECF subfamily)
MRRGDERADVFDGLRPRLVRIAYRMLGSLAEAEDVVQDAWLRWDHANREEVRNPTAYLARTVTRLCLDHLNSARARRESYVGSWLPEPLIELAGTINAPDEPEGVTLTLMMALERLSPLERAAFLLHDVFDLPFAEIAAAIGRDEAACRQLAARARTHVRAERPRFPLKGPEGEDLARAFFDAAATGDVGRLQAMLAENVVAYADGGGKKPAHLNPIHGRDKVLRLLAGLASKPAGGTPSWLQAATIDGLPGFIAVDRFGTLQTTALAIEAGRIIAVYTVRNPDKLVRVEGLLARGAASAPH